MHSRGGGGGGGGGGRSGGGGEKQWPHVEHLHQPVQSAGLHQLEQLAFEASPCLLGEQEEPSASAADAMGSESRMAALTSGAIAMAGCLGYERVGGRRAITKD